jgi:SAM-dependent methyltransferase
MPRAFATPRAHLRDFAGVDPDAAVVYFDRFYAAPLAARFGDKLSDARILDCACGSAWLSVALAKRGAKHIIAADLGKKALSRARLVVNAYDVGDVVTVCSADVTRLPFDDGAFDAVCTVETLEHVPVREAMRELVRVCRRVFVVETINRRFPIDTHDTPYPLVHWLPLPLRRRVHEKLGAPEPNRYPTLSDVERPLHRAGFWLVTPFKTFDDVDAWRRVFPLHHPYQGGKRIDLDDNKKWRVKGKYYEVAFALLGKRSRHVLDKIMGIYERH